MKDEKREGRKEGEEKRGKRKNGESKGRSEKGKEKGRKSRERKRKREARRGRVTYISIYPSLGYLLRSSIPVVGAAVF